MDGAEIGGTCDARFAGVREALRENFAQRGELGAAVAVIVEGRMVVDLWGGWADAGRSRPWDQSTVVNAFSVGKAFAALCVLMLVSRGPLDLDEPVARHWPQFAAEGKEGVTVRQVLGHRAGLAAIERELAEGALYEWEEVTSALAEQRPWWTPGAGHGYHVHTFGFLAGEIVRRVAQESVGSFLRREIAEPLGAEVGFGLARSERSRRAEYVFDAPPAERKARAGLLSRRETAPRSPAEARLYERAYLNPPGATGLGTVNTEAWQDAELPSANLHADARGVARVYGALVGDGALVNRDVLREATREASAGIDLVLGRPSRFGLGFQLTQPERPLGPHAGSFGHFGAGGSVGFADPDADLAFAYLMNRGGPQWQDPRNRALSDAVYEALGAG
ncbi:MAG TPA: serine hydrolase domain-containing protein [Solirubrobacteraceae bacterium]|jgi:CubicO group peptidase (beta-lactamase class C family)